MNGQPLKTSGAELMFCPLGKKLQKKPYGGWWHPPIHLHPPLPPLYVRGLSANNMYSHCSYLTMFGDVTDLQQRHNP